MHGTVPNKMAYKPMHSTQTSPTFSMITLQLAVTVSLYQKGKCGANRGFSLIHPDLPS